MVGLMVAALLVLYLFLAAVAEELMRRAPEGWECPWCKGEVIGESICPWCQHPRPTGS